MNKRIVAIVLLGSMLMSCISGIAYADDAAEVEKASVESVDALLDASLKEQGEAALAGLVTGQESVVSGEALAALNTAAASGALAGAEAVMNNGLEDMAEHADNAEDWQERAEWAQAGAEAKQEEAEQTASDAASNADAAEKSAADAQAAVEPAQEAQNAAQEAAAGAAAADTAAEAALDAIKGTDNLHEAKAEDDKAEAAANAAESAAAAAESAAAEAEAAAAQAQNAAQEAADAAQLAQEDADSAIAAYGQAQQAATAARAYAAFAQNQYNAAVAEYIRTEAEAKALLAAGAIDAAAAERMTFAAYQAAEYARLDAEKAKEEADAAVLSAEAAVEEANKNLQQTAQDLASAIASNASNVATQTGAAAATGAALLAADVVMKLADRTVNGLEKDIESAKKEQQELKDAVKELEEQIANAQTAVDEKQEGYDSAEADLKLAQEALEKAKKALEASEEILDMKETAEAEGSYGQDMKKAQDAIKADDYSGFEGGKTQAIGVLMDSVLNHAKDYDENASQNPVEIELVDADTMTYSVTDTVTGEVSYLSAEICGEEGNQYVQFNTATQSYEPIDGSKIKEDMNDTYLADVSIGIGNLGFNGNVELKKEEMTFKTLLSSKKITENVYSFKGDSGTTYYVRINENGDVSINSLVLGRMVPIDGLTSITVYDNKPTYTPTQDRVSDSNYITDIWDLAGEIDEEYVAGFEADVAEKKEILVDANEALESAQNALSALENDQAAKNEKISQLSSDLAKLDKELNGGLAESILRSALDGDTDAIGKELLEVAQLTLKVMSGTATEEEKKLLEEKRKVDFDALSDQAAKIREVIEAVSDGKLDINDVTSVVKLLSDTGLSAKTRQFIAEKIYETVEKIHNDAVMDLEIAVEKAQKEIGEKTQALAQAGREVLEADAAYAEAIVRAAAADLANTVAARAANEAKEAYEAADAAYREYMELLLQPQLTDTSEVVRAWNAYQNALTAAEAAEEAAAEALKNRDAAIEEAERAFAAAEAAEQAAEAAEGEAAAARSTADGARASANHARKDSDQAHRIFKHMVKKHHEEARRQALDANGVPQTGDAPTMVIYTAVLLSCLSGAGYLWKKKELFA